MRLLSGKIEGGRFSGALLDNGQVLDLRLTLARMGLRTIADLFLEGEAAMAAARAAIALPIDPSYPLDAIELVPPMGADVLLVATSGNYLSHIAEMGMPPPRHTHSFIRSASSLVGSGAAIELPPDHRDMVDWEGELCVVLGRACYRASVAQAEAAIGGYTILNDISARDWVPAMRSTTPAEATAAWRNNILFKQFPGFGPIGPWVVTADEIGDPANLKLTTRLNGEIVQEDRVGAMQFSIAEIIAQVSEVYRLRPGDIVSLGTPAGVGVARTPPRFLRPGDVLSVQVEDIGILTNSIAA